MAEFVNHHRTETGAVDVGKVVGVVNASTTVTIGVYQHYDMLVGRACQHVVQTLKMQGGEIAVAVEGIEVRTKNGVLPDALVGLAGTCVY